MREELLRSLSKDRAQQDSNDVFFAKNIGLWTTKSRKITSTLNFTSASQFIFTYAGTNENGSGIQLINESPYLIEILKIDDTEKKVIKYVACDEPFKFDYKTLADGSKVYCKTARIGGLALLEETTEKLVAVDSEDSEQEFVWDYRRP